MNCLIEETKKLVASERKIASEILRNLQKIEQQKLHLKRGHASLFVFCTRELGYSEAAAQRRIDAMRALKELPSLAPKLESGALNLSTVALAQKTFRGEAKRTGVAVAPERKAKVFEQLESQSQSSVQKILAGHYPQALPKESVQVLTPETTKIQFVADAALLAKLEKLRTKYSHKNLHPSYAELFHLMADELLKEKQGRRRQAPPPRSSPTRYIPLDIKREVWQRDQAKCQYRDPVTGRKCESTHLIQYDHIHPLARDGKSTTDNLQLLCAGHNLLKGARN